MIIDQMGKLPSELLPNNIGRFMDGWEAIETNTDTKDAYKNGIDNTLISKLLRYANNHNSTAAFNPIRTDKPNPIPDQDMEHNTQNNIDLKLHDGLFRSKLLF